MRRRWVVLGAALVGAAVVGYKAKDWLARWAVPNSALRWHSVGHVGAEQVSTDWVPSSTHEDLVDALTQMGYVLGFDDDGILCWHKEDIWTPVTDGEFEVLQRKGYV